MRRRRALQGRGVRTARRSRVRSPGHSRGRCRCDAAARGAAARGPDGRGRRRPGWPAGRSAPVTSRHLRRPRSLAVHRTITTATAGGGWAWPPQWDATQNGPRWGNAARQASVPWACALLGGFDHAHHKPTLTPGTPPTGAASDQLRRGCTPQEPCGSLDTLQTTDPGGTSWPARPRPTLFQLL